MEISDLISEKGYKNTGTLILVPKGDKRQCVFEKLVGGKAPDGKFPLTLLSHPNRAIVKSHDKGADHFFNLGKTEDAIEV